MKVLILANNDVGLYKFRKELIKELINPGSYIAERKAESYEVFISLPEGEFIDELKKLGCQFFNTPVDRHGVNPKTELKLMMRYRYMLKKIKPDIVLGYTIKPNIYGAIAAYQEKIPFIANITGLGTAIEHGGIKEQVIIFLYRIALRNVQKVFFQNQENCKYMISKRVIHSSYEILPGSGVNLMINCFEEYPPDTNEYIFTVIGRIMKDKGIDEILKAVKFVKKKYPYVKFRIIGFFDDAYQEIIERAVKEEIIEYIPQQKNIHPFIAESHAIIHASYHEGMSNVLLEAAATGRPVIASNIPGCIETFEPNVTGIAFKVKDADDLTKAILKFIKLSYQEKKTMGYLGRERMVQLFDRTIVVKKYIEEIRKSVEK